MSSVSSLQSVLREPMGRDFKKIKAFQKADDLAIAVYKASKLLPKEEMYGLTSQLKRAVVSVAANIVEGSARNHSKEYLQFLYIAKGSLAEVSYYLHLLKRLEYLPAEMIESLQEEENETIKVLQGLINYMEREA